MTEQRLSHEIELSPAFHDLDPMDIVWHGNYVKYLELARNALMAKFNYDYPQMRESGYAWPVIDLQLRYVRGATFGQRLIVRASLVEWESRLKINYLISDAETGERMTRASSIQVAVHIESREMQLASPKVFTDAVERVLS